MSSASYCPNTPEETREMLAAIGVAGIDELFAPIPAALRAKSFDLPAGMSEFEMFRRMEELAARNSRNLTPFIGGGYYDHVIPAV
ncbi:MAG TPA: glycine dehydrogenase, partial [Geobacteraceae bacterium]|nr:glycine dehydrogenase [Geobacteraceae bacterium]